MSDSETLLEVRHLSKKFADSEPLRDVNCSVRRGEVISIIGPSGTGKSTFLRCINRLEKPSGGQIFFRGEEIKDEPAQIRRLRQKIGMVFQSFNLFSNMNVLENIITAPMMLKKIGRAEATEQAMRLLEAVELKQKAANYPDELSGGQKQRIAIVRTLAMEPEIILFDEPTSALDPRMVDDVLFTIRSLAKKNYTMMIVTHEMRFAQNVSDRIFFMSDGIIYEEGSPQQIFEAPEKDATKIFIQRLKTYEKVFDNAQINLLEVQSDIEAFARKQFMSGRRAMTLQLIFEELIYESLLKRGDEIFPVEMKMFYNDAQAECEIKIVSGGAEYNPLEDVDEISASIIKGSIKSAEFKFDGKNILTLKVK